MKQEEVKKQINGVVGTQDFENLYANMIEYRKSQLEVLKSMKPHPDT